MKEILSIILNNLADNKDAIEIVETEKENHIDFNVKVASTDMGKIIGRQGKIAKSIRTLMKSLASKEKKTVSIEFSENIFCNRNRSKNETRIFRNWTNCKHLWN